MPTQEVPVNYSKAKGQFKVCVPWLMFPESSSRASRYVVNLKPASQAKAPRQVNRLFFTEKLEVCFSLFVPCSGVVAWKTLSFWLFLTYGDQKCSSHWSPEPDAHSSSPLWAVYACHFCRAAGEPGARESLPATTVPQDSVRVSGQGKPTGMNGTSLGTSAMPQGRVVVE